ncbi:hypothetical protein OSTOST_15179 [Ostertagia ostertagi]
MFRIIMPSNGGITKAKEGMIVLRVAHRGEEYFTTLAIRPVMSKETEAERMYVYLCFAKIEARTWRQVLPTISGPACRSMILCRITSKQALDDANSRFFQ